jgi:hypothetical protein
MRMTDQIEGLSRCPQCGTAWPTMQRMWGPVIMMPRKTTGYGRNWAVYQCTTCKDLVLTESNAGNEQTLEIARTFPPTRTVDAALPEKAQKYLQQAMESLHTPDGAAMLTGSAVDAMLKAKNLTEGSVYRRIDEAVATHLLTKEMGEWAHAVRLGSNGPRHADLDAPHVSVEEAKQAVEFATTLGLVLFVLPDRVVRGRNAATTAKPNGE